MNLSRSLLPSRLHAVLFTRSSLRRAAVTAIVALGGVVTGCGGGDDPPPVAGANITVAAGGTVTSDDGKVLLVVAPNSASADATATIEKAVPSAAMLAEPGYVADSAYQYRGPDLEFDPPALWELASPLAVSAAAVDRKSALGRSAADFDVEQLCSPAYAQSAGVSPRSVWVRGSTCPASCTPLGASRAPAATGKMLCAPPDDLLTGPLDTACPAGTDDASAEPAWAPWATANATRVCAPAPAKAAPVLGSSLATATTSCGVRGGRFACNPPQVTSTTIAGFGVIADEDPPKSVSLGFSLAETPGAEPDRVIAGAYAVFLPDGDSTLLRFYPKADDSDGACCNKGIGGVQIQELNVGGPTSGIYISLASKVVWDSGPSPCCLIDGVEGTFKKTGIAAIVSYYANSDPPVRYFRAKAWDKSGNAVYSPILRISRLSPTAPVIASFTATPSFLPIGGGGATVLAWDVNGATNVNILPTLGNVATTIGSAPAVVTATTTFILTATNGYGQTATAHRIVTVEQDTTAPVVTLASSATSVIVPATVTLTATASDAVGVAKVEFLRGSTVIATDFTAPYAHSVALGAADVGSITFRARAYDAAGNVSTTSGAVVAVTDPPGNGDTHASPTGVDVGNTTCVQATPCLTIAKAASLAQPNKTVWLANGAYTTLTQPAPISIPAGLTVRAVNAGLARVSQGIVLQGGGSVVGVVLPRDGLFESGSIQASNGTVVIDSVRVTGTASITSGIAAPITLTGTAQATMTPGAIADYTDQLAPAGQGKATYAALSGSARLTVNGGTFGGAALGGADGVNGSVGRGAFLLTGASRLDLVNTVVNVDSSGVALLGGATQLFMTGSTLHSNVNSGPGAGIHAAMGSPQITLVGSSITGFANSYSSSSAAIVVGTFSLPGVATTLSVDGTTLSGNDFGIVVHDFGSSPTSLTAAGSSLGVTGNSVGGIVCDGACSIDLAGGTVSGNGTSGAITSSGTFYGGIWLGAPTKSYFLKLRNVLVTDNRSLLTNNTNQPSNSGVTMAGNAGSGFDLGSAASPGGNVFTGNTTGSQTTGLNAAVAPGVTVRAVGNTFIANVQGADALGKYQLGTAPCGPASCNLTSTASSGANFRIGSGTLRLAE